MMDPALAPSHRLDDPLPKRVAVFRALQLGDMLCVVPALRALRAALPQARITLVGLPWARDFVERFRNYLDDLMEFPGAPGLPERTPQPGELHAFVANAQRRHFDLAIQMHGSGVHSNRVVASLGATSTAGFFALGGDKPDAGHFLACPEHEPEVWRSLRLMEFLGIPLRGEELEFPIFENDRNEFDRVAQAAKLEKKPYVCIHPGARFPTRRWPPDRFAAVADALAELGFQVVLTGTEAERFLAEAVAQFARAPCLNLAGRTSLGSLAVLLSNARLLVCNDTGVSHLAAALRVPSVVVYTASDYERWAPLDRELHRAVLQPIECRPCAHLVCPIGHPCANMITPHEVIQQAARLLHTHRGD